MPREPHLQRRGEIWYWRRRLPVPNRNQCLAISLTTPDRAIAGRVAKILDATFEDLMAERFTDYLPPWAQAAIMREARDLVLERLARDRATRGPDQPRPPRSQEAESHPVPPSTFAELNAFLATVGDAGPSRDGTIATVPPELWAELMQGRLEPGPRPPAPPSLRAAAHDRANLSRGMAALLEADLAANDLSAAAGLLPRVLSRLGLEVSGTAAHQASEAALAGMIQARRDDVDRNRGKLTLRDDGERPVRRPDMPAAAAPVTRDDDADKRLSPAMPLGAAFERYLAAKRAGQLLNKESERDATTAIRLFTELVGDRRLQDVTRDHALRFREDLSRICSDWGQNPLYAAPSADNRNSRVSARRAVEISLTRSKGISRLSPKTINKQTGVLNDLWNWCAENAGCGELPHPFKGLQKKPKGANRKSAAKEAREAFRILEIERIFRSNEWTSKNPFVGPDRTGLRPGARPSLYFGTLLAPYGGLRLSEICQLRVGDVRERDGYWTISIIALQDADYAARLGGGRHRVITNENRVKSEAADRVVPLHPVLVRCGFIDYLRLRGGDPHELLFTDVEPTAAASDRSRRLSHFFLSLKKALGLHRPRLTFHSFRHTARTMLDAITGDPHLVDRIIGHEDGSAAAHVRETYNKGHWYRPLFEQLSRLSYGVEAFGEDTSIIDQLRRDGFPLAG